MKCEKKITIMNILKQSYKLKSEKYYETTNPIGRSNQLRIRVDTIVTYYYNLK